MRVFPGVEVNIMGLSPTLKRIITLTLYQTSDSVKVTVQFETEGSGQNEIFINMDRSEVKP